MVSKAISNDIFDKVSAVYDGKAYVKYHGQVGILDIKASLEKAGYTDYPDTPSSVPSSAADSNTADDTISSEDSEAAAKTLTVLVDKLNIRTSPSSSAASVGHVQSGESYPYSETAQADGYTWYEIGENQWIADKDGQYIQAN